MSWVKGQPRHYLKGHSGRKTVRWAEEDRGYKTPCWIWRLAKCGTYGGVKVNGRMIPAHKALWQERYGPVPEGLELDHLCRSRDCVNPDHLEAVSHAINVRRGLQTKLTESAVEAIRELVAGGLSQAYVSRLFGIRQQHVSRIVRREQWK